MPYASNRTDEIGRGVHKVIGAQLEGFPAVSFEIGKKDEGRKGGQGACLPWN